MNKSRNGNTQLQDAWLLQKTIIIAADDGLQTNEDLTLPDEPEMMNSAFYGLSAKLKQLELECRRAQKQTRFFRNALVQLVYSILKEMNSDELQNFFQWINVTEGTDYHDINVLIRDIRTDEGNAILLRAVMYLKSSEGPDTK
jgi:hypothetical protein